VSRKEKYNPPIPFYDRLMIQGNEYEEAVKASDIERRANRTNWATFKDGKLLLNCTNIDEEAKRDEAEAHRITEQRNLEKIIEENRIKESQVEKELQTSMVNLDQMRNTKMSLTQSL
jgi:hypothetical protein